jgi:hypothetical protein
MGEPVEVPTEAPPQPYNPSDASSAAAAMPLSFKSSRRLTLWTVIQALMRFSACAAEDAELESQRASIIGLGIFPVTDCDVGPHRLPSALEDCGHRSSGYVLNNRLREPAE